MASPMVWRAEEQESDKAATAYAATSEHDYLFHGIVAFIIHFFHHIHEGRSGVILSGLFPRCRLFSRQFAPNT
jgi:hypothetical protein